ncbi:hypothetical protein CI610_03336 [invertebrate metagenome]|uniref:Uncharacterized protein n=1 Tax=invertebrate metagenome TaxID=1711999 RepID=A0A2H9T3D7_9ZZZZ
MKSLLITILRKQFHAVSKKLTSAIAIHGRNNFQ